MIYSDLTTAFGALAQINDQFGIYTFIQNPDFVAYVPRVIEYGEGRCYREIVPLATRMSNATARVVGGLRTLPLGSFFPQPVVLEGLALITPVGTIPSQGTRWQYEETSIDFIDSIWPVEGTMMAPSATDERYWALVDNQTVVIAPTPDQSYTAEGTGIFRPTPMSDTNPSSYLGTFYPDIFLAACMIAVCGFQKEWSTDPSDPGIVSFWEKQFETLKGSANEEEQRRRGQGPGNTPLPPAPEQKTRRA
jgi:hypothetical protein